MSTATPTARLNQEQASSAAPLIDMTANEGYKGEDGGLYGGGRNVASDKHLQAALAEIKRIQPLDAQGNPDSAGKIVMISIGMSNTAQEFSVFMGLAQRDAEKARNVVIVNGAQSGRDAEYWSKPGRQGEKVDSWEILDKTIEEAGFSPQQVQVAWIKQAQGQPRQYGEFPGHARELQGHLRVIVQILKQRYPNMRIAYLSSRIYGGYALATNHLNPEPYAYESAFSVRWLIEEQLAGKPELNYDPQAGEVKAPLLLWGPYLWADGLNPRSDGLIWERGDLAEDGTHPSASGQRKVAELLLKFFKTDLTAASWFMAGSPK